MSRVDLGVVVIETVRFASGLAVATAALAAGAPAVHAASHWTRSVQMTDTFWDVSVAMNARGRGAVAWGESRALFDEKTHVRVARFDLDGGVGRAARIGRPVYGLKGVQVARSGAITAWGDVDFESERTWIVGSRDGFRLRPTGRRQIGGIAPAPFGGVVAVTTSGSTDAWRAEVCRVADVRLDRCRRLPGAVWEDLFYGTPWNAATGWNGRLVVTATNTFSDIAYPSLVAVAPWSGRWHEYPLPLAGAGDGVGATDGRGGRIAIAVPGFGAGGTGKLAVGVASDPASMRPVIVDAEGDREIVETAVVAMPDGGALAAWTEREDGEMGQLRWARLDPRGRLVRLDTLDETDDRVGIRLLRVGSKLVATWTADAGDDPRMRSAEWDGGDPRRVTFGGGAEELRGQTVGLVGAQGRAALAWRSPTNSLRLSYLR